MCGSRCLWQYYMLERLGLTVWVCLKEHMPPFYLFHLLPSPFSSTFLGCMSCLLSPSPSPYLLLPFRASVSSPMWSPVLHSNNKLLGSKHSPLLWDMWQNGKTKIVGLEAEKEAPSLSRGTVPYFLRGGRKAQRRTPTLIRKILSAMHCPGEGDWFLLDGPELHLGCTHGFLGWE